MLIAPLAPVVLLTLAAALSAQSHRISGELAHSPGALGGDVDEVVFTADGNRVLYLADGDVAGWPDLYSAPADGSAAPVNLSAIIPPPGRVDRHEISSAGTRVVFSQVAGEHHGALYGALADGSAPAVLLTSEHAYAFAVAPNGERAAWLVFREDPFSLHLEVAPADGSALPIERLSLPDYAYSESGVRITPDGARAIVDDWVQHVLFVDGYFRNAWRLLSMTLDGSEVAVALNPSLPQLNGYVFTPDSSHIVFLGKSSDTQMTLFRVPVDGSAAPVALSGPMAFSPSASFRVSPDGERVVYQDSSSQLYSVPFDGSAAPVRLDGDPVAGGGVRSFQITPDGARVVYRADQLVLGQHELFHVPIEGGLAIQLSGSMVAGGDVLRFEVVPASVVFLADRLTDGVEELFAVPFGGELVRLSQPAGREVNDFRISPDGAHVTYHGDLEVDGRDELFRVSVLGGASTKLNGALPANADVRAGWALSPDSSQAAYLADERTDEIVEAFRVPIAGGTSVLVNGPLTVGPPAGDVTAYAILPGAGGAIYLADGSDDEVFELYHASLDGQSVTKLSGTLVSGGDVLEMRLTDDGGSVLFLADALLDGRNDLFVVASDGSSAALRLSEALADDEDVLSPEVAPGDARVVYFVQGAGGARLYSVPIGGGTPQPLSPSGQSVLATQRIAFSPDGTHLVYRTQSDVYAVSTDGSAPAVRVNGRFGPGNPPSFAASQQITPDGTRVVYLADAIVDQRFELFSVPIDGGGRGAVRLNGPLVPGGDVTRFEIAPDSSRVVYLADQEIDNRAYLYSVPVGGGLLQHGALGPRRPWVRLHGVLHPQAQVGFTFSLIGGSGEAPFRISPDGSSVVFVAGVIGDLHYRELFRASVAGGDLVQLTSGNSYVETLRFSPDGERIVFGATQSVCADGSEPVVDLCSSTSPLSPISPDGDWVVCLGSLEQPGRRDLYAVPIDGSQTPLRISGPSIANGDVVAITTKTPPAQVTNDSQHVVFRADQDQDEVFELYATELPDPP